MKRHSGVVLKNVGHDRRREGLEDMSTAPDMFERHVDHDAKPHLLMLSHCVPSVHGRTERVRAWQLLRLLSQTHRVHLACIADGPVNLAQWRQIQSQAQKLAIEPTRWWRRTAAGITSLFNAPAAATMRVTQTVRESVHAWSGETAYQTVLCTHPALIDELPDTGAALRICDLHVPTSVSYQPLHAHHHQADGPWQRRQARLFHQYEQSIARRFQAVLVNHEAYRSEISNGATSLAVQDAIDISSFPSLPDLVTQATEGHEQDHPRVVVHADWHYPCNRRMSRWFSQDVWPVLSRSYPNARLVFTQDHNATEQLRDATLVICPTQEPGMAASSTLQAMAMRQPVIAPASAMQGYTVQDGEQLLLLNDLKQLSRRCVDVLESPTLRWHLARTGRQFVQQNCDIAQAAGALQQLFMPRLSSKTLAAAA